MNAVLSVCFGILLFFLSLVIIMPETNLMLTVKLVLCCFSDYFFVYTFIVGYVMTEAAVIYAIVIVINIVRTVFISRRIHQNIVDHRAW